MKRTTYHDMENRKAARMFYVYSDEEYPTAQINELESAPPSERDEKLIARLRQERTDLIVRNISHY